MGFTRIELNKGLRDTLAYPALPKNEEEAREQIQGRLDELKVALNNLMGALENADTEVSGAAQIGSEQIANLVYNGVSPSTVRGQIIALNQKIIDTVTEGISIGDLLSEGSITSAMLDSNAVTADKIAAGAVGVGKIAAGAVSQNSLGTIQEIKLDTGDTLIYDTTNNKLKLIVSGCQTVQLCPVIFSKDATPVAGTYPGGTIYIQYVE